MRRVAGTVWRDRIDGWPDETCPEMVTLPSGEFSMGSSAADREFEMPQHLVRIGYVLALGKFPVTYGEWFTAVNRDVSLEYWPTERTWPARWPVVRRYCEEVQRYIDWLNESLGLLGRPDAYRLPSEAEWEYACRAGTTTDFHFGDTLDRSQANVADPVPHPKREIKLTPVGSFPPNSFGLYDMHGNCSEWCADVWRDNYVDAPCDGSPVTSGEEDYQRVIRGGSWFMVAAGARSAFRNYERDYYRSDEIGFRLARTLL
ncbi:MAG: formylglycine-generating enzyme family protein [Polyangiaceae bacterium]